MNIISLLSSDNYIVINRDMLKEYGINVTLMIGELASEYNYYDKNGKLDDGMFFSTIENISEKTGLSKYQQAEALKTLDEMGIVKTIVNGIPAKRFFKLDVEKLEKQIANSSTSGCQKTGKLDGEKLETKNNNKTVINNSNNKNIYRQVVDLFNETCVSFPKVTTLSEKRKKAIHARLNTYTIDDFKKAFEMAEQSDFLKGNNNRDWQANFDWMIRDANIAKILDGNYQNRNSYNGNIQKEEPKQQEIKPVDYNDFLTDAGFDAEGYNKAQAEYRKAMERMMK